MARERENKPQRREEEKDDLIKKLVAVNRVTKVVKGGRTMRFSAVVVVGDGQGRVGMGTGKAGEVPLAIEKATNEAKNVMKPINMVGTTIPHNVIGKFGKASVVMLAAKDGTGVIAGGAVRAVMEAAGIKNIRTKMHGTSNPFNCVRAVLCGLHECKTAEQIAAKRGKTVEEILG